MRYQIKKIILNNIKSIWNWNEDIYSQLKTCENRRL